MPTKYTKEALERAQFILDYLNNTPMFEKTYWAFRTELYDKGIKTRWYDTEHKTVVYQE